MPTDDDIATVDSAPPMSEWDHNPVDVQRWLDGAEDDA